MMSMHDFKLQPSLKIVVSTTFILISQLIWYTSFRLKFCINTEIVNGENWFVDSSIYAKLRYSCIHIEGDFLLSIYMWRVSIFSYLDTFWYHRH